VRHSNARPARASPQLRPHLIPKLQETLQLPAPPENKRSKPRSPAIGSRSPSGLH
ncbi:hypothetical protein P7K49_012935, partial [Saguinus oedipus]